ncbi:MAG: DUF3795 domain-containing protein [Sedimentisphaerales bacterium]|nr:DUF3795 domain-containing protein [Sedimentisphaerales bacterium]
MTRKTDLIGYCGLYCGDCTGYTQTVANSAKDLRTELKRHRFAQIAPVLAKVPVFKEFKDYDKCYNLLGTMTKIRCTTCRGNGGPPKCEVRRCCRKKKIQGCWECNDFAACEKLKFLEQNHGAAHLKNLRKIKKQGPKAFVTGKRYWYAAK